MARTKSDNTPAIPIKSIEALAADVRTALDAHRTAVLAHLQSLEDTLNFERLLINSARADLSRDG